MRKQSFDYQGAKNAGYTDEEISSFLTEQYPQFDFQGASQAGYSPQEINEYLSSYQPERTKVEKSGRVAGQYAIGALENTLLPYELGVAPLASKEAQQVPYRENLGEDIENLLIQKQYGNWSPEDEEFLQNLQKQIQDPRKSEEFIKTADIGIRGLAEKATGLDLHPEGVAEKAANWAGFLKNPKEIAKIGLNPKDFIKAIAPTGSDVLRGLGAGTALEMAEQGDFGPIGTMAAAIAGDVIGAGSAGALKGAKELVTNPKETLAKVASAFTPNEKKSLQKEIIKDFREAGIQADLGTITDNNLIKWTQSRLAQSGLTGKALDDFRKELTGQIKRDYESLASSLGEAKFSNSFEAGQIIKEGLKGTREADLSEVRKLYENANKSLKENAFVNSERIAKAIEGLENQLKPGQVKSGEQKTVLDTLSKLKRDIFDTAGNPMYANVKDLMNNKLGIQDIINYEVQGGAKQLLKGIVAELDRAIISHGKENPSFAKNYINANKKFSEHAKTFRNKNIDALLKEGDPEKVLSNMGSVYGIRKLSNVLKKTPQGKELFNNLKRLKLDQVIGNNLVDSTTQQVKLGTFSKLLEKGKNKDLIKEILGPQAFKRLEKLQKNAGRLADAAQKFYNASQSGVVAADAAVLAKGIADIANLLSGNPWPLLKLSGGLVGARKLSQLFADPEFLKLVEEIILASEKGSQKELIQSFEKIRPYILMAIEDQNSSDS